MKNHVVCLIAGLTLLPAVASAQVTVLRPPPQSVGHMVRQDLLAEHGRLATARDTVLRLAGDLARDCRDVPETSTAIGPCRQRQGQINQQRMAYNADADRYNDRVVIELDKRIADMRAAIAGDQGAIRNLGLARTGAEADALGSYATAVDREWIEQRDAAFRDAGAALAEFGLQTAVTRGLHTSTARAAINKFTITDAQRLSKQLRASGVNVPAISEALEALARAKGAQKAAKAEEVMNLLRRTKAVWDLKDLKRDTESAKWQAGYHVVSAIAPDKRMALIAKLTLAEVRLTFYAINANIELRVINSQIDRLSTLTDQQLLNLKSLSARLDANVDALNAAKAERAAIK
jgi:hypothetical protein